MVAEEVRKLAEESQKSSENIQEIAELVMESVLQVSAKMENSISKASSETDSAEKAKQALLTIVESMDRVLISVETMNGYFEDQGRSIEMIQAHSKEASAVAIETSSASEEVSASSLQTVKIVSEISNEISKLIDLSKELRKEMNKYNIGE